MKGSEDGEYRILMVDDDESLLEIGSLFMEKFGFRVFTSTSGKEALFLISSNKFDAIVSDFQMPGMNGLELLKRLRADGYELPFVMLTGHGSEEIARDALNNGADYYLIKEVNASAQYKKLSEILRRLISEKKIHDFRKKGYLLLTAFPDSGKDMFAVINSDLKIVSVSPSIGEVLGYKPSELIGKDIRSFIEGDGLKNIEKLVRGSSDIHICGERLDIEVRTKEGTISKFRCMPFEERFDEHRKLF